MLSLNMVTGQKLFIYTDNKANNDQVLIWNNGSRNFLLSHLYHPYYIFIWKLECVPEKKANKVYSLFMSSGLNVCFDCSKHIQDSQIKQDTESEIP